MTTDLPAMRRFKSEFPAVASRPFAAWLATELAGELGDPRFSAEPDLARLVADVEAEGNALIGAVPCPRRHGIENNKGEIGTYDFAEDRDVLPCPACGAAL